ncbi:MAG: ABC transporter permease [Nitrospirae bacterium]|nr:ABC transporter permease [Nitrospirota bacterium]
MLTFILKRLLWGIPVLLAVATITFIIMHVVPGGPFDTEKQLPPEIKANIEEKYHLDKPFLEQYLLYLGNLVKGDLGPSYKYTGRSVNDVIKDTFPVSIELGLIAFITAIIIGTGTGIISAVSQNRNTWLDRASMLMAVGGVSIPHFVLAALLILVLSQSLHIFPPALWEGWDYSVLPAVSLAAAPAAYIARLMRSSFLDVLKQDYIRTCYAKGLPLSSIYLKHVLKNAVSPLITLSGPLLAALITGSFIIEYIFSIPGMGKYFVTAVINRDYPLIMGVTLIYAVLIVLANICVDLLYAVVDPRVRRQ